jgi:hypothetical protein
MMAPPHLPAILMASVDFPEAVGPAIKMGRLSVNIVGTGSLWFVSLVTFSAINPSLSLQQTAISDYLQRAH